MRMVLWIFVLTLASEASDSSCATVVQPPSPGALTVELVNDSDVPADQVYVLLSASTESAPVVDGIPKVGIPETDTVSGTTAATPLNCLYQVPGRTVPSLFGDRTRRNSVYQFTAENIKAGRLFISFGDKVAFTKVVGSTGEAPTITAPTAAEPYRFDKMELTFLKGGSFNGANLTSIDFFGIPLQTEVFHGSTDPVDGKQPQPVQASTRTYYVSTSTLLKTLAGTSPAMSSGEGWSLGTKGSTFDPESSDFGSFLRILTPQTLAGGDNDGGRPTPYPSFRSYLKSLSGQSFTMIGESKCEYRLQFSGDDVKGYDAAATATKCTNSNDVRIQFPAEVDSKSPHYSLDFYIYGCFPDAAVPVTRPMTDETKALVRDIYAGLNFGLFDSDKVRAGGNLTSAFVSTFPFVYPYGAARRPNDGFYNPWASMLFYLSDSYGHPYSDRIASASPFFHLTAGDTLRVTILPDHRLDAPVFKVSDAGVASLTIDWSTVAGATSYEVSINPQPTGGVPPPIRATGAPTQQYTVTGLSSDTPYMIRLTAVADDGRRSNSFVVQGLTIGPKRPSVTENAQSEPFKYQMFAKIPDAVLAFAGLQVSIDKQPVTPEKNAMLQVEKTTKSTMLDLTVSDANGTPVYRNNIFLTLDQFCLTSPSYIDNNIAELRQSCANPLVNAPVFGTDLTPRPTYVSSATMFPGMQAANAVSWTSRMAPGSYAALVPPAGKPFPVPELTDLSLPLVLGRMRVLVNGTAVPIQHVAPTQINFLIPADAQAPSLSRVALVNDITGMEISSTYVSVDVAAPALITWSGSGAGPAFAFSDTAVSSFPVLAVKPASTVTVFGTGLGKIDMIPTSSDGSVELPLADVAVKVNDASAKATMFRFFPGPQPLWLLTFVLPEDIQPGKDADVRVTWRNIQSRSGTTIEIVEK